MQIRVKAPDNIKRLIAKTSAVLSGTVLVIALEPDFHVKVTVEVDMGDGDVTQSKTTTKAEPASQPEGVTQLGVG